MYKWFYAGHALTQLPLFTLVFFLAFFLAVVLWVTAVKRPADFEAVAALPLEDSSNPRVKP